MIYFKAPPGGAFGQDSYHEDAVLWFLLNTVLLQIETVAEIYLTRKTSSNDGQIDFYWHQTEKY